MICRKICFIKDVQHFLMKFRAFQLPDGDVYVDEEIRFAFKELFCFYKGCSENKVSKMIHTWVCFQPVDEHSGRYCTIRYVTPADKCFCTYNVPGSGIHNWLIQQIKAVTIVMDRLMDHFHECKISTL